MRWSLFLLLPLLLLPACSAAVPETPPPEALQALRLAALRPPSPPPGTLVVPHAPVSCVVAARNRSCP